MPRNTAVEEAVTRALDRVDAFIADERLKSVPGPDLRRALDVQLAHGSNSVRLASLFFVYYAIVDDEWDCNAIPTGLRGEWGDKRLAAELNQRHVTLHNSITAFGENLGWKGNVAAARLRADTRFDGLATALSQASLEERRQAADYMAARFAESRTVITALPPVGPDVLTYTQARVLLTDLITVPSEGNIQQFLIAGLLRVHRQRFGHSIRTHHVHASDTSDRTAGDIEEFRDQDLMAAYEVTVRPDWTNRVPDFRVKMDKAGLRKYVIFASNVNQDEDLAQPAQMLRFLEPYERDIAVVDILDAVHVFAAELSADELRKAVNQTHDYLISPRLCGRADIVDRFSERVSVWLDTI
ncbi:MAG: hypothetical protein ACU0BS_13255 [Hasllibacter sp.]